MEVENHVNIWCYFSVNGVYGCGTMYSRLSVHIEVGANNEREEEIRKRISEIAERNNIKDSDYDVKVVESRPGTLTCLIDWKMPLTLT